MKHFITIIPHQMPGQLHPALYQPMDNSTLEYAYPTCFPIVNLIASSIADGERCMLTSIMSQGSSEEKNHDIAANYELLRSQVEEIKDNLGIDFTVECVPIETSYDSNQNDLELLMENIVGCVRPDDELYVCVTYGEKTDTLALYQALMRIRTDHMLSMDVDIAVCVYGQFWHGGGPPVAGIWDITGFLFRFIGRGTWPGSAQLGARYGTCASGSSHEAASTGQDVPEESDVTVRTKHFTTFVSLFPRLAPRAYYDEKTGKERAYEQDVCFPIIPIIAENVEEGETIVLNPIIYEGMPDNGLRDGMARNLGILLEEGGADDIPDDILAADGQLFSCNLRGKTFNCRLELIRTPYEPSSAGLNMLCNDIQTHVGNGDEVYACVTFGRKADAIVLVQALAETMASKTWNVDIPGCVYGYDPHTPGLNCKLKDVTALVIDGASELIMRRDGIEDPQTIRNIFFPRGGEQNDY